jgi:protoporphyrinogen/coproporphyrinogen III oxidase
MDATRQVIVIGAGITGLACAFGLKQAGIPVLLLEASDSPGGVIATFGGNGFLFEAGPQCPRFPLSLWELVRGIGLESEFVRGDSRAPRYILKNRQLHRAPFSPLGFISTGLVGAASKYRILAESLRRSQPPGREESLAEFVRRKFDGDILDYLVDPFIAAVFAGDTEKIGVDSAFPFLAQWEREYGSLLAGAIRSRKNGATASSQGPSPKRTEPTQNTSLVVTQSLPTMGSFRAGLGTLPKKLAQMLAGSIRWQAKVDGIEAQGRPDAGWRIRMSNGEQMDARAIVVTAPSYEAARLLKKQLPAVSALLSSISYAPIAVISSGYDRARVRNPLAGFGLMIPRRETLNTIFNVWNSSVFPGRAPDGKILMTSFAGGAANPDFIEKDETAIAEIVEREMGSVLGIEGPPVERFVWKHRQALPQFNVGHAQTIQAMRTALERLPGLYLAGNYFGGRSLGDCVETGSRAAEEISVNLRNSDI